MFSGRNLDSLFKVSKDNGEIIWRAGGKYSDFEMGAANFSRQHHARFVEQNATHTILSVLDNAMSHSSQPPTSDHSSGKIFALDMETKKATLLAQYHHPHGGYAWRRGNLQILPNQNAFLCWSEHSLQSEHTQDGRMIMEAQLVPDIGTYRSQKYKFVGRPILPPDVISTVVGLANVGNATQTKIYASWNGATEVASWRFYKSTESGDFEEYLGSVEKQSFETVGRFHGYLAYVVVEGMDRDGQSLGRSRVTKTDISGQFSWSIPDLGAELQWLKDADQGNTVSSLTGGGSMLSPMYIVSGFFGGVILTSGALLLLWHWTHRRRGSAWFHNDGPSYASLPEKEDILAEETEPEPDDSGSEVG